MTLDRTAAGGWRPGGPSLYSARMALALGARVTVATTLPPSGFDRSCLCGLDLIELPAADVCRYENRYPAAGGREQELLAPGAPLAHLDSVLAAKLRVSPDVFLVAPAFHELDSAPPIAARVTGVALQGVLREVDTARLIVPRTRPFEAALPFLRPGTLAFFSDEDTPAPETLAAQIVAQRAIAVLTRGPAGADVFEAAARWHVAPVPARPTDPTGAGDCFATAFLIRFAETGDLATAGHFAAAAGALAVEREGLAAVATRAEIEARLHQEAA